MTTTTYPTFLDDLADTLLDVKIPPENPRHRAILDAYRAVEKADQQLLDLVDFGRTPPVVTTGQFDVLVDRLAARLAAGRELGWLLSDDCCCAGETTNGHTVAQECHTCPGECIAQDTIVDTVLQVFSDYRDPDAMSSADVVAALRELPGIAEGRWRYSDLTQTRLAQLLAPYGITTRDITLPDGRRRKSYQRTALRAALQDPGC